MMGLLTFKYKQYKAKQQAKLVKEELENF